MATLQEQRQAIGDANEKARRANGDRIQDQRRAVGDRLIEERTGKSVAEDLNRLVNPVRQRRTLSSVPPVGAVPASQGRGSYTPPAATTGGIASPLTEKTTDQGGSPVADREYYPAGLVSSDGLLVLPAIKKQTFTDANGAEVVMDFATPGVI